ncbi:hypothetical protein NK6_6153 [Bradyrhizobium diazoefficiens]|uniref:Uncharacterized protein n=1 Tax=Bradyrhizobium diazoefficiens TaxID=1355477 RepID=A0A0E4FZU5_9BRAD|nr:hypothetical protein NK6_6153 [Bradyrhizobium diazoefficiens]
MRRSWRHSARRRPRSTGLPLRTFVYKDIQKPQAASLHGQDAPGASRIHDATPGKGRIDRARRGRRAGRSGVPLTLRGAPGRQLPRGRSPARGGSGAAAEGQSHAGSRSAGPPRGARLRRARRRPRPDRPQPRYLGGARALRHARDHGRRRRAPRRRARLGDRNRRAQGHRADLRRGARDRRDRDGAAQPRLPRGDLPRRAQPTTPPANYRTGSPCSARPPSR